MSYLIKILSRNLLFKGFNLPAKTIIHTVGPNMQNKVTNSESAKLLQKCYQNSLILALKHNIRTIVNKSVY